MRSKGLRRDLTPVILHSNLLPRGGGLARAVPERASLYARHFERVLVLTSGFNPRLDRTVAELRERGALDERVEVRNFFRDSSWAASLGVPPAEAYASPEGVVSVGQQLRGRPVMRVADRRQDERFPFRYRYYDDAGRHLLTGLSGIGKEHEVGAIGPDPDDTELAWGSVVGRWVDEEIAGLRKPVLFSLQRGLVDPVLLATTKASRKVVSLHNCHYNDPLDRASGLRGSFRPALKLGAVDEVVCLTQQQRSELETEVPHVMLRTISYPGRAPKPAEPAVEKDPLLVVLVAQLQDRKRVDHAIRSFVDVRREVPGARLEIYGYGLEEDKLRRLVERLGLQDCVHWMGYSFTVGEAQARAVCTLLTSTFEGFARVISESMSRGTPVVAYDVRYGPRDLIRDGVDGVLVTTHEPSALAAAIVDLLRDPERAAAMGERAREVVDRYPVAAFEESWLRVLSPRRKPARVVAARARLRTRKALRRIAVRVPRPRVAPLGGLPALLHLGR